MKSLQKLDQAVVVVTGGGSGIGRALCRLAAQRGARIVVADLLQERSRAVAAEIENDGGVALALACDVGDLKSVQALAEETIKRFGTVNLVCNNAGVCMGGSVEGTRPDDARWMFEVNVFGLYHGIRVFADLVPSSLLDLEHGASAALLELERAVATRPEYLTLASQLHVVATR